MPKIDGMDPKLVRDLLAELGRAAKEMESIEAAVTTRVRNAGVPAAVTYRPSAVADAIVEMDKDITARLTLLEKRERDPNPRPTAAGDETPATKPVPKPAPEPAGGTEPPKPTSGDTDPPKPTSGDTEPPKKTTGETDPPKPTANDTEPPKKSDTETDPPKPTANDTEPPKKSDTETDPPKKSDTETDPPKKSDTETDPPKKSEGETPPPKGESPAPQKEPIDTPKKDHPDDIDQTRGRIEINVDGTKVVSQPLNLPDDVYLVPLDKDIDTVRPVDTPGQSAGTPSSTGPQPDGKPGYVEPLEPTAKQPAPQPGLAPGDPMGEYVGTPADNLTEDPYLKSNPAAAPPANQPGLAPGDPNGAYVGTAADNVTEDPFLKDNPVTQPAPQPGLAPGDPNGAYVGTPADNLTDDPYLQGNPTNTLPEDTVLTTASGSDVAPVIQAEVPTGGGEVIDPKALAAAQPGDVLSAPANPISDQALGGLLTFDDQIAPQGMPTVTDGGAGSASGADGNPSTTGGNQQPGGSYQQTGNGGTPNGQSAAGGGDAGSSQGGDDDGKCGPQGGADPAANGSTTGQQGSANSQSGLSTGPTMAHYGPADLSADGQAGSAGQASSGDQAGSAGQSGSAGQAGAEVDPRRLAAELAGDVLYTPADPISDQALGALLDFDDQIGPQEMPSMTTGGSGSEGGPAQGPSGSGSDQSAGQAGAEVDPRRLAAEQAGAEVDPRRLAAEQAGDVLYTPANPISDQAFGALLDFDDQIGPQEMPSMTTGGSGSEGGPAQGPSGSGSDQSAGQAGAEVDPKRLAAEQPGDVLSAPAKPVSDEAIAALMKIHGQIEPMDMPSVSVPEGEWGTGEWVPMDVKPDGPAGSVAPGQPT
ncbi:hypothetical protein [Herbidospora mongoliensis]|uniref:hypothetical protein n=1 Tax=Herbidospora mongoliensis TaxID=688067 RepID=UPI00082FE2F5|nr:hypothetical protein [Herbidospora mongoliensis]